jgi:hypothetical protein
MSTGFSSAAIPNSPTIGTATATSDVAATVTYTAAVLGATGSTFTATSNPSSITGTGSSPITVTGLTASTAYTFTVTAGNANGTSAASSASNSITTDAPFLPPSYESIATVTVGGGGASSISFTSIPQTFTHLQLRGLFRSDYGTGAGAYLRINNDTTSSIYSAHGLSGNGSSASAFGDANISAGTYWGIDTGPSSTANSFGANIVDIIDYKNTNKFKTVKIFSGQDNNASGTITLRSGLYRSTTAISRLDIVFGGAANWLSGTTVALYGIKGA